MSIYILNGILKKIIYFFVIVVEYIKAGDDRRQLKIQITITKKIAFFLDVRWRNGRTIAMYLKNIYKKKETIKNNVYKRV